MEIYARRKKTKTLEENHNCLTKLPEHVLHHILSFLTMKDVIRTCVLSRKWRYIWSYVPCLNFSPTEKFFTNEMIFITRCLFSYKGSTIQKLNIVLKRDNLSQTHLADMWIQFAFSHNVKEFCLKFACGTYPSYTVNKLLFNCRSLTVLELLKCSVIIPKGSKLLFLETLSLENVCIAGELNGLVSTCAHLQQLSLKRCNIDCCLISNNSMKTLRICECRNPLSDLEVYAPSVVFFEFGTKMNGTNVVLKGTQALEEASFVCRVMPLLYRILIREEEMCFMLYKMLDSVRRVKTLRIDRCYIEAMSIREKKGEFLSIFNVEFLEIEPGLTNLELPGLAYMLKCSPNVETLIIDVGQFFYRKFSFSRLDEGKYFQAGEYWKDQEPYFSEMLKKLKIVKVRNFLKDLNIEEMKHDKSKFEEVLKKMQSVVDFFEFFLNNCEGLEKISIWARIEPDSIRDFLAFHHFPHKVEISFL